MDFKLGVGKSDFDVLRKAGNYYVDKTELIYKLVNDTDNIVTLFTRPRRFGKTLNMSMMESFFSIRRESRDVFEGLDIMEHEDFCREWMNQYPVLFISLKDVEGDTFESAFKMLKARIADVCKDLSYLLEEKGMDPADVEIFQRLRYKTADEEEVKNSLKTIMRMMYDVYGRETILLIDEYDVPIAKANDRRTAENDFYRQMLDVIRGMVSIAVKDNRFLKFAVVTGCLRMAKESIFTGANNFASYSVLDHRFSSYFGFSQEEVLVMLKEADREDKADIIRSWYDGYVFGNSYVYCPWDVISYMSALLFDRNSKPKNYWKNTSGNEIIRVFVANQEFDVADRFETLMNGGTIRQMISDDLTYEHMEDSEDNLWSVLLMTGYLTKADPEEEGDEVALKIPNEEIASIFRDKVADHFRETMDRNVHKELMDALWSGDEETAGTVLSDLLWETISYNNYHENYYHAFLTGLFAGRSYGVTSDQENGLGRTDIVITDRKNRRAIIIEAKKAENEDDMEKACQEGKQQIIQKQYVRGLAGYRQILCYGVAFYQKTALVRKL